MTGRRLRTVFVSVELLSDLLRGGSRRKIETDFPDDGRVVAIRGKDPLWSGSFEFLIESESFEPLQQFELPPEFTPTYQTIEDDG